MISVITQHIDSYTPDKWDIWKLDIYIQNYITEVHGPIPFHWFASYQCKVLNSIKEKYASGQLKTILEALSTQITRQYSYNETIIDEIKEKQAKGGIEWIESQGSMELMRKIIGFIAREMQEKRELTKNELREILCFSVYFDDTTVIDTTASNIKVSDTVKNLIHLLAYKDTLFGDHHDSIKEKLEELDKEISNLPRSDGDHSLVCKMNASLLHTVDRFLFQCIGA